MNRPKTPKNQKCDTEAVVTYYPHSIEYKKKNISNEYITICSIDPAVKTYAIRIERQYYENDVIIPLLFDSINLFDEETTKTMTICNVTCDIYQTNTYHKLTKILDQYLHLINQCDYIVIEKQIKNSYFVMYMARHTISYLSIKLKDNDMLSVIFLFCPKLRNKLLNYPKELNSRYYDRKKYTVEVAKELLRKRNDQWSITFMEQPCYKKKQDDLADTVAIIEGFRIHFGFPITVDIEADEI